ncbi:hypothetical protein L1987_03995 [Smallanthus sonchifolius]|uniref:Uncharacterized protein n=1 Tax=Smallanthus sonchifolius TaxID=185202 RepID=A0ACB9KCG2_9ASTR|nr:hypothetical protein L1987_03995 [Smallanthus sonchifolius]
MGTTNKSFAHRLPNQEEAGVLLNLPRRLPCIPPTKSSTPTFQSYLAREITVQNSNLILLKMPIFARMKRVTDPLDDRVKDRIVGRDRQEPAYVSSGSEHSARDDSLSSLCLSELLDCFLQHGGGEEEEGEGCNANADDDGSQMNGKEVDSDSECDSERTDAVIQILISTFRNQNVDRFRNLLLANVLKGIEIFQSVRSNRQILHRNVMLFLQNIGYNAAICKTKWESCGGLTSGNYEFIDVVRSDSGTRYYIDVNFAGEFDIARETEQFRRISQHLQTVFVGKSEDLKQIVKLLSDATRRSLKSRGLLLPPWRKNRFMQNKWFGPYRRTVNYTPTIVSSQPATPTPTAVKCRLIGFNAVSNAPLLPAATRTR